MSRHLKQITLSVRTPSLLSIDSVRLVESFKLVVVDFLPSPTCLIDFFDRFFRNGDIRLLKFERLLLLTYGRGELS